MTAMAGLNVVVTGGTGSFGRALVRHLLAAEAKPRRVTVVSRDEQKQFEMAIEFPPSTYPVQYRLGDVRNAERMLEVTQGADVIVHAASMKHVLAAENNPMECVRTNVLGSHNVVTAALRNKVPRVIALSTDKAALPSAFYGASKLMLERLFLHADLEGDTRFTVVRYANVFGTRGSVVPLFLKLRDSGVLPITDPEATRFSITLQESVALVLFAQEQGWGGEIIVPVAPSYRITDVARAIAPDARHSIIGLRPGEKPHELLVSQLEAPQCVRRGDRLVICPVAGRYDLDQYAASTGARRIRAPREYSSNENDRWLGVEDIQALVNEAGLNR